MVILDHEANDNQASQRIGELPPIWWPVPWVVVDSPVDWD
jgi:hypothetical protein